jgi:hypothetical protein
MGRPWKQLRRTRHTHNPVDDALGNVEALITMADMGLTIPVGPERKPCA